MAKHSFKQGDRVRAVYNIPPYIIAGDHYTIAEISPDGNFVGIHVNGQRLPAHYYMHDAFTLLTRKQQAIVISTDGQSTDVKLTENGELKKAVRLVRWEGDPHDLKKLAAYAVQKLLPDDGNLIVVVGAGYTGALCVCNSRHGLYANGRILEFREGVCTNPPKDDPEIAKKKFKTLFEVEDFAVRNKFRVLELHRRG
jgi:hypothetical protein